MPHWPRISSVLQNFLRYLLSYFSPKIHLQDLWNRFQFVLDENLDHSEATLFDRAKIVIMQVILHIVIGVYFWPWNAARRWRNPNSWLGDLEMLLEDGETRTRGYKNLEMLLEDGETGTRGCKNLGIRCRLDFQPFCEPAFLALHYPRPPCAPSFIKSRTLRILPIHFLFFFEIPCMYTRGES